MDACVYFFHGQQSFNQILYQRITSVDALNPTQLKNIDKWSGTGFSVISGYAI